MSKNRISHVSEHAKTLCQWARDNGWSVQRTRGDHIKLSKPGCESVYSSTTPSCKFAARKAIAKCRSCELKGASA